MDMTYLGKNFLRSANLIIFLQKNLMDFVNFCRKKKLSPTRQTRLAKGSLDPPIPLAKGSPRLASEAGSPKARQRLAKARQELGTQTPGGLPGGPGMGSHRPTPGIPDFQEIAQIVTIIKGILEHCSVAAHG